MQTVLDERNRPKVFLKTRIHMSFLRVLGLDKTYSTVVHLNKASMMLMGSSPFAHRLSKRLGQGYRGIIL